MLCDYAGQGKQELCKFGNTVRSVLRAASAHGMQSIAMPLIGHGLAGWPAKLAAQTHVQQVLRFFNSTTSAASLKVLSSVLLPIDSHPAAGRAPAYCHESEVRHSICLTSSLGTCLHSCIIYFGISQSCESMLARLCSMLAL